MLVCKASQLTGGRPVTLLRAIYFSEGQLIVAVNPLSSQQAPDSCLIREPALEPPHPLTGARPSSQVGTDLSSAHAEAARSLFGQSCGEPRLWLAMIPLSPLILDLAKLNTHSSPFFQPRYPMTVLPIRSSLEPGPINDRGPRGSDHHTEWKDLFSARRFSIAVGISESDTEATVWQPATMVCDAGNRHPGPLRPVGPVSLLACHTRFLAQDEAPNNCTGPFLTHNERETFPSESKPLASAINK